MQREAGIVYVSTGNDCSTEAVRSARSARAQMPSVPIALFSDAAPAADDAALFDAVTLIEHPSQSCADKIAPLKASPFAKTLFVDADTVFLADVTEVFGLLDRFQLAYCQAPLRATPREAARADGVPECFTEPDTGVIAFCAGSAFSRLVDRWQDLYDAQQRAAGRQQSDQPAFRKALYLSDIRTCVLPPEYNLRTPVATVVGGTPRAKLLHGRGDSLERAIAEFGGAAGPSVIGSSADDPARDPSRPGAALPSAQDAPALGNPSERLRSWVIANLFDGSAPAGFDDDTDLIADGVMDSLAIMQLLTHLEADHGVTVAPGDIVPEHFQSLRAIADYLAGALPAAAAAANGDALAERGRALAAAMPHLLACPSADYVLAPYVNTTLRPNMATEVIHSDAYGFRLSHDDQGMVDSERWRKRPRRALLVGNSFAMGWSCSGDDQTLASHLGRLTPYSFLNLGITGASSLQETIAAVPFLEQAHLVVVVSGVGNLLHYLEYGCEYDLYGAFFPQQLFLGVRQARIDTLTAALRQDADAGESPAAARAELAREVARHARTMGEADAGRRPGWSKAQVRARRDLAVQHQFRDLRLLKQALEPETRILYAMQPTSTLAKPELEPDEQAMLAAVRQFPMWKDVFEPYARDQLPAYTAAIRANCEALGVPYLDLNEIDYPGICFVDYGHTTDLANVRIAEHLARHLEGAG